MFSDYLTCTERDNASGQPATYRCFGCSWPKSGTPIMLLSSLGREMPYCAWCAHVKGGGD